MTVQTPSSVQTETRAKHENLIPFRRAVEVRLERPGLAVAEVEDDHHHFQVEVEAEDGRISGVQARAIRRPWSLCALAAGELGKLVGAEISADPTAMTAVANSRHQCTHMFDLAGEAQAALARGGPALRRYDMQIQRLEDNLWRAELRREDGFRLDWLATLEALTAPGELAGRSVKGPFTAWAREYFSEDVFPAAVALRRALFVGKFRHDHDLDARKSAGDMSRNMGGCFVLQPERAHTALRMKGSTRSFPSGLPQPLSKPRG